VLAGSARCLSQLVSAVLYPGWTRACTCLSVCVLGGCVVAVVCSYIHRWHILLPDSVTRCPLCSGDLVSLLLLLMLRGLA
jgi:hypothetical protein